MTMAVKSCLGGFGLLRLMLLRAIDLKQDLIDLLGVATKGQLSQFNGSLYEEIDGVAHSAIKFTMEVEKDGMLPFLGNQLLNRAPRIETKVFVKPMNSGLLLHYHSHIDNRYKRGAYRLSSSRSYFT